jgi:hypothetical protein
MVIKKRSCLESGTDDGFDTDYDATQEPNKRHKTAIEQEIEEAEEYERRKETEQRRAQQLKLLSLEHQHRRNKAPETSESDKFFPLST